MRSAHIAEWILALVTTRDRATSTVGDLTEQAAARDAVWFWLSVLRATASLLWRDVAEHAASASQWPGTWNRFLHRDRTCSLPAWTE